MSDAALWADMYPVDLIASGMSTREGFERSIEAAQHGVAINEVVKRIELPGSNILDLSLFLLDGVAHEVIGGELLLDSLKNYENRWPMKDYNKGMRISKFEIVGGLMRGIDLTRLATGLMTQHMELAQAKLVDMLNNGAVAATVPARVDDTAGNALFSAGHTYNTTAYANLDAVNTITAAGLIEANLANLRTLIAAWEAAPNTNGRAQAFGNMRGKNLIIIASVNLKGAMTQLHQNSYVINAANVAVPNELAGTFDLVFLPGMTDDSVVLTRKQSDIVPGFMWALGGELPPWTGYEGPTVHHTYHLWQTLMTWCVAPTTPQASLKAV